MSDLSLLATRLTDGGRGLLAVDQSPARLDEMARRAGLAATESVRRGLVELVLGAPGLDRALAGMLVDAATLPHLGPLRLRRHRVPIGCAPDGVDFARRRWMTGPGTRTAEREEGAREVAGWAAGRQRAGVVPLVECVVGVAERDQLAWAQARHADAVRSLLSAFDAAGVERAATVLGLGVVLPGRRAPDTATVDDVARATLGCLAMAGVDGVAGIVFTAAGQPSRLAGHLAAMRRLEPDRPLGYLVGSTVLNAVARTWRGRADRVVEAQGELTRTLSVLSETLSGAAAL